MQDAKRPQPEAARPAPKRAYEKPQLKKYGSIAHLTRSGTGTIMEGGKGPSSRFA